jgi:predicted enzyme related to lactoylglutathione lyase
VTHYDRTVEDIGNVVTLEHVNTRVPDQQLATLFYGTGLGLTRDPYLMTGVGNMWMNVGRSQFHLPTGKAQVVRGHTALVLPNREALVRRLGAVKKPLEGTRFAFKEHNEFVEVSCPWGNRLRCFAPAERFGRMQLGIPYVEFEVPRGTSAGIVRFYREILETAADAGEDTQGPFARASAGAGQQLVFRETEEPAPPFDGHHVAIYLADFSSPHRRLLEKGLVTQESDQHQYRFEDIVDLDSGKVLFTVEHEVRSMRHPMYARPLVNRNPEQSNRSFAPGHEELSWSLPLDG